MSSKLCLILLAICLPVFGVDYTWVGSAGGGDDTSWSDPDNWSPSGVPDTAADNVIIDDSADVHLNASEYRGIGGLDLLKGCAITIHTESRLVIKSEMTNDGQVKIFDTSSLPFDEAMFELSDGVIADGTGSIEFSSVFENTFAVSDSIIGSEQSLLGLPASRGMISGNLENRGLINVDSAELQVHGSIDNQSAIEIVNSGEIVVFFSFITNTLPATILIETGSILTLEGSGSVIGGGTINGGGTVDISSSLLPSTANLENVTINSAKVKVDNEALGLVGTLWNNGEVNLYNAGLLSIPANAFVDGNGEVIFRDPGCEVTGAQLTIGAHQTVRTDAGGSGDIQSEILNYGTLEARAGTLDLGGTNAGVIMSTLGGRINLGELENSGHLIQASSVTSSLHSVSGEVDGGTLRGPGTLNLDPQIRLIDVTLDGNLRLQIGDSQQLELQYTLTNDVDIALLGGANIHLTTNVTMDGSGSVSFGGSGLTNTVDASDPAFILSIGENQDFDIEDGSQAQFQCHVLNYGHFDILDGEAQFDGDTTNLGTVSIEYHQDLIMNTDCFFTNDVTGLLTGEGRVTQIGTDALINAGTLAPGLPLGRLRFTRDLELLPGGHLAMEISDTEGDVLEVGGTVTLDGDLDITFLGGFFPDPPDQYILVEATTVTGTFDNATPSAGNEAPIHFGDDQCIIRYETDSVVLCDCTSPVSDLAIEKTVDQGVTRPDGTVTYTLTAYNYGPADATGVVVEDQLPAGFSHIYDTCGLDPGPPLSWEVGNLASSGSATCEVDVTIDAQADCHYLNTATISGNEPESSLANNTSPPVNVLVSADFMDLLDLWPDFNTAQVIDFVVLVNCALPDD